MLVAGDRPHVPLVSAPLSPPPPAVACRWEPRMRSEHELAGREIVGAHQLLCDPIPVRARVLLRPLLGVVRRGERDDDGICARFWRGSERDGGAKN